MSVKRYASVGIMGWGDGTHEDANGNYVRYEDYARLKADVKMLEQESAKWRRAEHAVGDKCIEFAKTIQTLKAENESLRKAGDMCDQLLACFEMEGRRGVNVGRDMWRAAKEENPSV